MPSSLNICFTSEVTVAIVDNESGPYLFISKISMAWVAFFDLFINLPNKLPNKQQIINANTIIPNKLNITFLYVLSSSPKESNFRN